MDLRRWRAPNGIPEENRSWLCQSRYHDGRFTGSEGSQAGRSYTRLNWAARSHRLTQFHSLIMPGGNAVSDKTAIQPALDHLAWRTLLSIGMRRSAALA